jgi:superfamily II DNA or RNA helicase
VCEKVWSKGHGVRVRGIVKNDARNQLILHYALRFIRKGKSVLISVQYKEHCQKLYDELVRLAPRNSIEMAMGGVEDRDSILKRLDQKKTLCVVATSVFGEGVNIPSLNLLILGKASSTKTDLIQTVGRVLRRTPKKKKVIVIDFEDRFKTFTAKTKFRKEILQEEPEFVVKSLEAPLNTAV